MKDNIVNCGTGFVTSIQDVHTNNNRRLTLTLAARADIDFISSNSSRYTFLLNGKVENRKKRGWKGYRYHHFNSQMEISESLAMVSRVQRVQNGTLQFILKATNVVSPQLFIPTVNGSEVAVNNWEENFVFRTVLGPSHYAGWQPLRGIAGNSILLAETYTDTGILYGTVGCN